MSRQKLFKNFIKCPYIWACEVSDSRVNVCRSCTLTYHLSSINGVESPPAGDLSGFLGEGRGEGLTPGLCPLLGVPGLFLLCLAHNSAAFAQSMPAELEPGFELPAVDCGVFGVAPGHCERGVGWYEGVDMGCDGVVPGPVYDGVIIGVMPDGFCGLNPEPPT